MKQPDRTDREPGPLTQVKHNGFAECRYVAIVLKTKFGGGLHDDGCRWLLMVDGH